MTVRHKTITFEAEHSPQIHLKTAIFQSDTASTVGKGVCRAVVETYLRAILDYVTHGEEEPIKQWRKDVNNIFKDEPSTYFKNLQAERPDVPDFDPHGIGGMLERVRHATGGRDTGRRVLDILTGGALPMGVPNQSMDAFLASGVLMRHGFYHIGIPRHAVGLWHRADGFNFVDANTGEWEAARGTRLDILSRYFELIYPRPDSRVVSMYCYYPTLPWK